MKKLSAVICIELASLILILIYDLHMISAYGSSWDNVAAYFNSLAMIRRSSYYEILREPLIQLMIIPILEFTKSFIPTVETLTIVLSVIFFLAIRKLSKSLKMDGISVYMISLSGIVIGFMSILNATDIFGLITIIMAFAYYYEGKKIESSIFFGLSFLAKFTNLIFLFYLPFIFRGKDLAKSMGIVLAINLPWFIANYILYGNPFYGYLLANSVFSSSHVFDISSLLSALLSIVLLSYQFILVFVVILLVAKMNDIKKLIDKAVSALDMRDYSLLGIALVEYFYVGSAQNYVAWLGYPVYIALLLITLKVVKKFKDEPRMANSINVVVSFSALAVITVSILSSGIFYGAFQNRPIWFSGNPAYNQSLSYANQFNCSSIYSNAWPYLMVYDPAVKPSTSSGVATDSCLISFNTSNVGIPVNLNGSYTKIESNQNFSVFYYK